MGKNQKDVKPITARQTGELARLLEERGMDGDIFQRTLVENPDGVMFFSRGKIGAHFGKTITIEAEAREGLIIEVHEISSTLRSVIGIARNIYDYSLGNIVRVGDEVTYDNGRKGGIKGKVIKIDVSTPRLIITSEDYHRSLDDIIRIEFPNLSLIWASLRNLGF